MDCQFTLSFTKAGKMINMDKLVLDLVSSYENRISMVEELVTSVYKAIDAFGDSLGELDGVREGLKINLSELLSRNCSFRKKDFSCFLNRLLSDSERGRLEIKDKEKQIREELKKYLDKQKELAATLKEQLAQFSLGRADKSILEAIAENIRVVSQNEGEELFSNLLCFQSRVKAFQREQDEINHSLQRLLSRGESLKIEDLRQLESVKLREKRKVERALRRGEVEKMLSHFQRQRRESMEHIQRGGKTNTEKPNL
jgi:hypothetical protein